jgi:glycosyltransferase involved in cell wall biosynthesis
VNRTNLSICFLCSEYPPAIHGGIGSFTRLLARSLVERGHRIRVLGAYRDLPLPTTENDRGVHVFRIPEPKGRAGWIRARLNLWRTVNEWARDGEIDLVEIPDYEASAAFWPALPIPVISRLHGSITYFAREMNRPVQTRHLILDGRALRRSDAWCSCSAYTLERTQHIFDIAKRNSTVIHNFAELPQARVNFTRASKKAVFTGTVVRKKGVIPLIRSWSIVNAAHPDAELHIYGKDSRTDDGSSMCGYLRSLVDANAAQTIHFHGHVGVDRVTAALRESRVAVFPSYAEAFSLAPLEAMANGCPTIYTRRGSGPELIRHGRDGLLVDPDNSAELAQAMIDLLGNDQLAITLAASGFERVRSTFSREAIVPRNEAFYASCIERFSGLRSQRMSA